MTIIKLDLQADVVLVLKTHDTLGLVTQVQTDISPVPTTQFGVVGVSLKVLVKYYEPVLERISKFETGTQGDRLPHRPRVRPTTGYKPGPEERAYSVLTLTVEPGVV